ncbi:MAG: zinc ribbon domain-containing protein [Clostridiales bacterium]|nr:zinc ribbon domain-containing protein [Clostridiales bacterium]
MDIEDITLRIKSLGKDTVAEVQKVAEVRQYRSQITAEKKRISAMYTEIGKKLYDENRETPPEGFEAEFHSLKVAFDTIEELRGHIRTAKGVALCPNCRMEVGMSERFCSNCGCKMPEVIKVEGEEWEEIPFGEQPETGEPGEEPAAEATEAAPEAEEPAAEATEAAPEAEEPAAEASEAARVAEGSAGSVSETENTPETGDADGTQNPEEA